MEPPKPAGEAAPAAPPPSSRRAAGEPSRTQVEVARAEQAILDKSSTGLSLAAMRNALTPLYGEAEFKGKGIADVREFYDGERTAIQERISDSPETAPARILERMAATAVAEAPAKTVPEMVKEAKAGGATVGTQLKARAKKTVVIEKPAEGAAAPAAYVAKNELPKVDGSKHFGGADVVKTLDDVQDPKSRSTIATMSPESFLRMTGDGSIPELTAEGGPYTRLPKIIVSDSGKVLTDYGEDRARAARLHEQGVKEMPVELRSTKHAWGEAKPEDLPQTLKAKGKGEMPMPDSTVFPRGKRESVMAGEARAEMTELTEQASREQGALKVQGTPTEAAAEALKGESTGPTLAEVASTEGVGERSEKTTNKERYAKDYLDKVLKYVERTSEEGASLEPMDDEMTPMQAHAAYGEPAETGRPRTFAYFSDYVRNIHEAMTAPGMSVPERIAAVQAAYESGGMTRGERRGEEARISKLAAVEPRHLQDILDELPTTKGQLENAMKAAEEQLAKLNKGETERNQAIGDTTDEEFHATYPGRMRPIAQDVTNPDVNRPVMDILRRLADGEVLKAKDLFDAITEHSGPRILTPHLAALVRQLKRFLPEDLDVISYPEAGRRFKDHDFGADRSRGTYVHYHEKGPGGTRITTDEAIALNTNLAGDEGPISTVVHEMIHAATVHYIRFLERASALSPRDLANLRALETIEQEMKNLVNQGRVPDSLVPRVMAAFSHKSELVTYLMTDPDIMTLLANRRASPMLMKVMGHLGFDPSKVTSVWQAFKNWVGKVFNIRDSDASVLNHIMDPLTQVIEAGGEYRQQIGTRYPGKRGVVDKSPEMGRVEANQEALAGAFDPKAAMTAGRKLLKDKVGPALRLALEAVNSDAIHTWGARFFENRDRLQPGEARPANPFTRLRDARDAAAEERKNNYDTYGGMIDRMTAMLKHGVHGPAVSELMNDATLAEVRLGDRDPQANAHVVGEAAKARLGALQDRYEALGQGAQKLYRDLRDYYKETYNKERAAEFDHALRLWLPDSTPAERRALRSQVSTRGGVNRLLNPREADDTNVAQTFGERWQNKRAVVQELARLQRAGMIRGDYFPLRRYGDYIVKYGERGSDRYGVEYFERESQAQARREELLKNEGWKEEEVPPVFLKQDELAARRAMGATVETFGAQLDRSGLKGAQKEAALNAYAEMQLRMGTRSQSAMMRARREGVLGPSKDQARNLANDFLAFSSRMGWLKHGPDQLDALEAMDRHIERMRIMGAEGKYNYTSREIQNAGMIRDEMKARTQPGGDASKMLGNWPRRLTAMSFVYNLMRPAHIAVQLADAHSNAESLLGARHGFGAAAVQLGKAVRDLAGVATVQGGRNAMKAVKGELHGADWNMSQLYRDRMVARGMDAGHATGLINALNSAGLIDHTQVREIQRMAGDPSSFDFGGKYGRFAQDGAAGIMNMFAAGEHAVDSMNRTAIAKAAFDLEMRKTNNNVQHSIEYAVQQARDAMPNYNLHVKPRIAQGTGRFGQLAQTMLQYKLYGLHMYGVMGNLAHDIYTGGGRGRTEAAKALSSILATHALLSGVTASIFGSLPVALGLGLYDLFSGSDKPHTADDIENAIRNYVTDTAGKSASQVIARGLPTFIPGVDLHRSLKLSNAIDLPELRTFKAGDIMATLGTAMTGASGENVAGLVDGMRQVLSGFAGAPGEIGKGLEKLSPRPINDVLQAYRFHNEGVTDPRGNLIVPPISTYAAFAKGLGFNPTDVASGREARQAEVEHRDEIISARDRLREAFVTAAPADRGTVWSMVYQFNRANPAWALTPQTLQQAVKEHLQTMRTPGTYGLRVPPKQLRDMQQAGRFGP